MAQAPPEVDFMNVDTTNYSDVSRAEQIRRFEVEGYVVLPGILPADMIAQLRPNLLTPSCRTRATASSKLARSYNPSGTVEQPQS